MIERLHLRPVNLAEIDYYYSLFSSPEVCNFMDLLPFKKWEDAEQFLLETIKNVEAKRTMRFSIYQDESFIGTITLYSILWHQKRASVGYALKKEHWNQGLMKTALNKLEDKAKEVGLNRIQATILPENISSRKVIQRSGYEFEGVLKEYEYWPGKGWVDLEIYAKVGLVR